MENKNIKIEITEEKIQYLINALNRVPVQGFQEADSLLSMARELQSFIKKDEK